MLELEPSCAHCNKPLSPSSTEARICSYECTFCATCVETIRQDVCPNCTGDFAPRPIRPSSDWKGGNSLAAHPPGSDIKHRPVDPDEHAALLARVGKLSPQQR